MHQPAGVGEPDSSEVVEKIVDLPEVVEPSTSAPVNPNTFLDEEEPSIDFPKQLPAGVRVDDKGNVFANNTLLFTKSVSVSARALFKPAHSDTLVCSVGSRKRTYQQTILSRLSMYVILHQSKHSGH